MRARELIDILAHGEAELRGQEFVAPLVGGRVRLRVRGLLHALRVEGAAPGWWRCRALDTRRAEVIDEALPWQRGDYLALLPARRLVLVERLRGQSWVALPYAPAGHSPSPGDRQRQLDGPVVLRLVEGGQPFERVVARIEGEIAWYDEADRRADPAIAEELRGALAAGLERPPAKGLGRGERAAYALLAGRRAAGIAAEEAVRTERLLREALDVGGARLVGYEAAGGHLRVTWELDGQRGVTLVGAGLEVVSAGICLSGEDRRFDLASIVGVVRDAPDYARWEEEQ